MRNTSSTDREIRATFVIPREKLARYREIVEAEHRTISQALRLHVDRTIAADDKKKRAA